MPRTTCTTCSTASTRRGRCDSSTSSTPGRRSCADGDAYLCGDLFYDVQGALGSPPKDGFVAGVQPSILVSTDPALSNNFTTSVLQEMGAIKRASKFRFILPAHDDPGVLESGRYVGRIEDDVIPGPVTPASARA